MGFGFQGNVDRELYCQTVPLQSRDNKIVLTPQLKQEIDKSIGNVPEALKARLIVINLRKRFL